jgi:hypothetical protein
MITFPWITGCAIVTICHAAYSKYDLFREIQS